MKTPTDERPGREPHPIHARIAALTCAMMLALLLLPATASAEFLLGQAKSAGQVGEQLDGYLGLIDQRAPADVKKMVLDTNERRKQRYEKVAARLGTSLEQVGKTAAVRHYKHTQPGELVQAEDGSWAKKGAKTPSVPQGNKAQEKPGAAQKPPRS